MCLGCIVLSAAALLWSPAAPTQEHITHFMEPIDGLSVTLSSENSHAQVRYLQDSQWSTWQELTVENEQDPSLLESNMVLFPGKVTDIELEGDPKALVHPLRVSSAPIRYTVAAAGSMDDHHIYTRSEWGADESLLYRSGKPASSASAPVSDDTATTSARAQECEEAQVNYPAEFRTSTPVTTEDGKTLRWPRTYSTEIKMLVVHHTAQSLQNETRSGPERMRALYQFHAQNRGWGDIGYHYVIDDTGKIYEGKSGGDFVIGGHAYCNNTNTIGIALMGNFDEAEPSQAEMRSLQWLLDTLAARYKINTSQAVTYHGKRMPAIVGHRDLLTTDCPGEYVSLTLDQVREHVASHDVTASIRFPVLKRSSSSKARAIATSSAPASMLPAGFSALGSTDIESRPGAEVLLPVLFRAGSVTVKAGERIGKVVRSQPNIGIAQEQANSYARVRSDLLAPAPLSSGNSVLLRIRVQLPAERKVFTVTIGTVRYTITAAGRSVRGRQMTSTSDELVPTQSTSSAPIASADAIRTIRIKLNDTAAMTSARVESTGGGVSVENGQLMAGSILLTKKGDNCNASAGGINLSAPVLRLQNSEGTLTLASWAKKMNRFRGILECRIYNNALTIINELPLEDYMLGLGEEPDTEPLEKQKAFAIAARTYALWYLASDHRKFPGAPYDGSDSPAEFQKYNGLVFEEQNPHWVSAVSATSKQVITYQGSVIKPPYFSSSDGRTRSPSEVGWSTFPFAEIFTSKPDPWCKGMALSGHGVGMSGCGAKAQANEGKTGLEILQYYYPGTEIR